VQEVSCRPVGFTSNVKAVAIPGQAYNTLASKILVLLLYILYFIMHDIKSSLYAHKLPCYSLIDRGKFALNRACLVMTCSHP